MEEYEIEFELYKLMLELQHVAISLEILISPYAAAIEEIVEKKEELSEPYNKKFIEIQDKIKELTLLRGKSLKTGSGNITYVRGSCSKKLES